MSTHLNGSIISNHLVLGFIVPEAQVGEIPEEVMVHNLELATEDPVAVNDCNNKALSLVNNFFFQKKRCHFKTEARTFIVID